MFINGATGAELWQFEDADTVFGPVAGDRTGYVADQFQGGAVVALDAATGERRWWFAPDTEVHPVAVAPETVFCRMAWLKAVIAVDAETGAERWRSEGWFLAALDGLAYLTTRDGSPRVVDSLTGRERGRLPPGEDRVQPGDWEPEFLAGPFPPEAPQAVDAAGGTLCVTTDRAIVAFRRPH